MEDKKGPVWVIADQVDGQVHSVTYQLIGQARKLAAALTTDVGVILLGKNVGDYTRRIFAAGADRVYLGDIPELNYYQSQLYTDVIVQLATKQRPDILLLASTYMGRELAPLIAAKLRTGLTAHCIDLVVNKENILVQKIPAYGGLLSIICPKNRPQMATVAQGVFPLPEFNEKRKGEVITIEMPEKIPDQIQTLEVVKEEPKGVSLASASIVVAGGAGAGDAQGWEKIAALARELNGALGCTRPAADEGWSNLDAMIGQSGKMVNPKLYIGIGLSGELQHMVGIMDAKVMVAINNDSKSPVFEQVDYGIVDDCREFVPVFIEKIKQLKAGGMRNGY